MIIAYGLIWAAVTLLVKAGVAVSGHSIEWLWAAVIAAALTFGGVLIIDGDVIE